MDFYNEKQTFIIIDFSMDTAGKEIYKILTTETAIIFFLMVWMQNTLI